tara:strand:+ start:4775 stop:5428 length:654 start_codon:yes stop_codon:yes gene_type:complete
MKILLNSPSKNNQMKRILPLLILAIIFSGCASIYLAPNGKTIANKHEIIAIVKPKVSIKARKKDNADAIQESQRTSSIEFQQEIYKYMLKRKSKGKILVDIQDVEETNALLAKSGKDIQFLTTSEICDILGVDGVITSNFGLSKPMSAGGAIALALLAGVGTNTNEVVVTLSIKNCEDKSLIWKYDHKYSGGIGSSPSRLVEGLMRHASKKMPYFKR